jgi:hypothetical protein
MDFGLLDAPSSQAKSNTQIYHQGHQVHQENDFQTLAVLGVLGG